MSAFQIGEFVEVAYDDVHGVGPSKWLARVVCASATDSLQRTVPGITVQFACDGSWESVLQADIPLCITRVMTTAVGSVLPHRQQAPAGWPEPPQDQTTFVAPPAGSTSEGSPPPPIAPAVAVTVTDTDASTPAAVGHPALRVRVEDPDVAIDAAAAAEAASKRHTGITVSPVKPRGQARAAVRGGLTSARTNAAEWSQWYGDNSAADRNHFTFDVAPEWDKLLPQQAVSAQAQLQQIVQQHVNHPMVPLAASPSPSSSPSSTSSTSSSSSVAPVIPCAASPKPATSRLPEAEKTPTDAKPRHGIGRTRKSPCTKKRGLGSRAGKKKVVTAQRSLFDKKAPAYDEDVDGVDDSRPLSALLKTASVARRRNDAVRVGIVMLQEPAVTVSADAVATAATMANAAVASVAAAAAAAAAGSMIASAPGRKKKMKSKKAAGTTELPSFTQTKLPSPKVGKGSSPKAKPTKSDMPPKTAGPRPVPAGRVGPRAPVHGGKKATKVHDGLTCNGCGKSFENKETLGLHKKRSGPAHNVRPECNVCKKQFSHGSNVLRHMMIHTGERPYKCDQCPKGFTQRSTLETHIRTHTGERPFVCDVKKCKKTFGDRSALWYHQRSHTNDNAHECEVCQKKFNIQRNLTKHLRTHARADAAKKAKLAK